MTWANLNLMVALPELCLFTGALLIVLLDVFLNDKHRGAIYILSMLLLVACACFTVLGFEPLPRNSFMDMFVADPMADVLKLACYFAMALVFIYSRQYALGRGIDKSEYFSLSLFALLGMMVMISANHFITLYMGLELLSLALYALVALQRESKAATEAAMKYFVLGALASGMLLYGMSMVYGVTGSLAIQDIAAKVMHMSTNTLLLTFGLVFLVTGIAFKLGAVPFHMWVPDVYHGAPTSITLLMGSVPKLAAFAFSMRLLAQALPGLMADWQGMLMLLAVLSMAVGNFAAIAQNNIKRMLAYSTIAHMGFMLLGILTANVIGYAAAMFYSLAYVLTATAAFGIILLLSRPGFEADRLADFKGLAKRSPWFALMMMLVMASLAGIPVFIGFFAKLSVLQAIVQLDLIPLAVVAVLFSVIGAFYYLRVIKLMYFDEPQDTTPLVANPTMSIVLSINCLAILVLGLMPHYLLSLCYESVQQSLGIL